MTKTQKIAYFLMLTMVSLLFIFSGFSKLTGVPEAVQGFTAAHLPIWFMYFIGTCEILGGVALWFALSSKAVPQKLAHLATYGLFIILTGAVVTTILFIDPTEAFFPFLVMIILCFILWLGNKRRKAQISISPVQDPQNE